MQQFLCEIFAGIVVRADPNWTLNMIFLQILLQSNELYSVTPKPGRWDFVNIKKIHSKYQLLMVRFIIVTHPPIYGEI